MPAHDTLVMKQLNEYQNAIRSACQHIRARDTSISQRLRNLALLDRAWKLDPWVNDNRVCAQILRAGIYSVLFRLPERGISGAEWPRVGLTLKDAYKRLDEVIARGAKAGLAPRMLRLAVALRRRLTDAAAVLGRECEEVTQ